MSHSASRFYHVYIMTNGNYTSLYTGVTNELSRRVWQHKHQPSGFAKRYRTSILVYCEETSDIREAITREKQIKNMHRAQKMALIESQNPSWYDLSEASFARPSPPDPVCGQDDKR